MSVSDTSVVSLGFSKYLGTIRGGAFDATGNALRSVGNAMAADFGQAGDAMGRGINQGFGAMGQGINAMGQGAVATIVGSPIKSFINLVLLVGVLVTLSFMGYYLQKVKTAGCATTPEEIAERDKNYWMGIWFLVGSVAIFLLSALINFFWKGCSLKN